MDAQITGATMPVLQVNLGAGEEIVSPHGELSWMSPNIRMSQTTKGAGGGGFMAGLKRMAGGGGLFLTHFQADNGPGFVTFASKVPGHIVQVDVSPQRSYVVHRHGWICGTPDVGATAAMQQSFRGGLWGGEGFILQRLEGQGSAWIDLSGELTTFALEAGQSLLVHPGHIGMFDDTVQFSIVRVPGIANKLFGGDGFHLVTLTGPGQIWLQSMPLPNLAQSLQPYLSEAAPAAEGGVIGGALGNLLRS